MTVKQAAGRLEISASLVYRLVAAGQLPCLRIGQRGRRGKIVIREEDLAAFFRAVRAGAD
jgi:excisionase family DNA binding protein